LQSEVRRRFQAASYSAGGQDWPALFRQYDRDNSGELEWEEFRRAVRIGLYPIVTSQYSSTTLSQVSEPIQSLLF
jgi:hypothetical protein